MVTTQNPITGLSGISNTSKKTSLDIPSGISASLSLTSNINHNNNTTTTTSSNIVPIAALSSNSKQTKSGNFSANRLSYCNSNRDSVSGTSESESDEESCQNNTINRNKTKSAFLKGKNKEKLRIRFEVEETVQCHWDPGPYAKSSDDSGLISSSSSIGLTKSNSINGLNGIGIGCGINDLGYNSQTLLSKKPKRSKSLKKLLTKSKSFVSARDSISRAELVAKYHQPKGDVTLLSRSQKKSPKSFQLQSQPPQQVAPCAKEKDKKLWEWGKRGRSNRVIIDSSGGFCDRKNPVAGGLSFCKNCGTTSDDYQTHQNQLYGKFQEIPIQKSWLGMAPSDIHFHGRYSRLPSDPLEHHQHSHSHTHHHQQNDGRNFHSLNPSAVVPHNKQQEVGEGPRSFYLYKGYYKSRKEYGVQQASKEMAHQERSEFQDQYNSYYDCRIPRPKLKFVIPTHSYGVTSSKLRRRGEIVDASGFSEISLSDGNEDGAYGSGSGCSSRVRSENSSDETISEFEREQELNIPHDERDYVTQVERNHSTEENSPLGRFPSDYTALYSCEKGIVLKGNSRRLLSFKKPHLPSLLSKHSFKSKNPKNGEHTEFLKSLSIFRKLSNGFLTKLCDHITEASYECGEYILRQGNRGEGLFILTSGTAKVTFLSNHLNGEEIYLRTLHPGDFFGEKSIQGEKINMMNVIGNEESVSCLIISEDGFEQLMTKSLEFRQRFSNKTQKTPVDVDVERIELEDLRLISTLGIGGFGRVELVTLASNPNRSFALKQMKKCQIVATRQVEHIKSEKAILMETNCDFITKLYKTFKDAKYLYMLMECCLGGELWTILRDRGHFDDHTTRFYVGCVMEALKYLHSRNIIYRDLKPENLLLDSKGYLKLVDFGFAKKLEGNKTWTFCGTPEYVAPEIILNKGHDITADYWSLGVLMYELLTGTPPFVGGDPMRTYKLILKGIDYIDFPQTIGKNAYNLIRKLCRENPLDRLGQRGGLSDIKKHKWFDGLEWNALRSKSATPPIIPYVRGPHDSGNFDVYPPDRSLSPPDDLNGWDWDF